MSTTKKISINLENKYLNIIIYIFFFVSGMAGLIYEVVWGKYLSLFIGNTAIAHTIVLATFMGGLVLGNYYIGRYADRSKMSLKLFAYLEIGIGIYCLLFLILVPIFSSFYVGIAKVFSLNMMLINMIKFFFSIILIIIPTFLMGGTFPVISKYMIKNLEMKGRVISNLYYLNSFGAVVGGLLAGFYLIPKLGLMRTEITGVFLDIMIGLVILVFITMEEKGIIKIKIDKKEKALTNNLLSKDNISKKIMLAALIGIGLSGATTFIYELVWIRLLSSVIGSSTYSFTLMLAAIITGITLGSWIVHTKVDKMKSPLLVFGVLELLLAFVMILSILFYERIPYYFTLFRSSLTLTASAYGLYQFFKMIICLLLMLVPSTIIGMTLPIITGFLTRNIKTVGTDIGKVFAVNTIGGVVGAVLTGLVFIPFMGTRTTYEIGILINILIGSGVVWIYLKNKKRIILTSVLLAFIIVFKISIGDSWSDHIKVGGNYLYKFRPNNFLHYKKFFAHFDVLSFDEDSNTSVTVTENISFDNITKVRSLRVNGKPDASNSVVDLPTMSLLGHIPMLLHGRPKNVAMVGLGAGTSAGVVLMYDSIQQFDMIEISSAVVRAADEYFTEINYNCLDDPRLNLVIEDAKTYLKVVDKKYDVIISQPSNPWIAGIGGLFTKETFRICKNKLADNGLFVQWFQVYNMSDETVRIIVDTFNSVFPTVTVWKTTENDIILVGHKNGRVQINADKILRKMKNPKVAKSLKEINITSVSGFLFRNIMSPKGVRKIKGDRLNTDYFPVLEYSAPRDQFIGEASDLMIQTDERLIDGKDILFSKYMQGRSLSDKELYNILIYLMKREGRSIKLFSKYLKIVLKETKDKKYLFQLARELEIHGDKKLSKIIYDRLK